MFPIAVLDGCSTLDLRANEREEFASQNSVGLCEINIHCTKIFCILQNCHYFCIAKNRQKTNWVTSSYPLPEHKPKISICLAMPFVESKLRSHGVSSTLASFMLYSLSPFLPNPEILVWLIFTYLKYKNRHSLENFYWKTVRFLCSGQKYLVGGAGYRSRYLSHAKRALYHLSYAPWLVKLISPTPFMLNVNQIQMVFA